MRRNSNSRTPWERGHRESLVAVIFSDERYEQGVEGWELQRRSRGFVIWGCLWTAASHGTVGEQGGQARGHASWYKALKACKKVLERKLVHLF